MAKTNQHGKGAEAQAASYKGKYEQNRKKRLERALKRNPNNKQIEAALKSIVYRRKTPTTPFWSAQRRRQAELFKLFTGKVHMEMFSNNEKVSGPALLLAGPHSQARNLPKANEKEMFMLKNRAHDGKGNLAWA